jgi:hypothetical protein
MLSNPTKIKIPAILQAILFISLFLNLFGKGYKKLDQEFADGFVLASPFK